MIEEALNEMPEQIKPVGVLDPTALPKGSTALTQNGRSFTKAAIHLAELQKRRQQLLKEYRELQETKLNALIQEIAMNHVAIDEIIKEMSQS